MKLRCSSVRSLGLAAFLGWTLAAPAQAEEAAIPLAIADFDYTDTSGEAADQRAAHAARLATFTALLAEELAASGKYRVVTLACAEPPCSAARSDPAELIEAARAAGAQVLLYGGIHKMSTLIQMGKAQAVDLKADKLVFDQTLSFRGDDDEAWRRAGMFLVEQLVSAKPLQ